MGLGYTLTDKIPKFVSPNTAELASLLSVQSWTVVTPECHNVLPCNSHVLSNVISNFLSSESSSETQIFKIANHQHNIFPIGQNLATCNTHVLDNVMNKFYKIR